jgi:hypothetical protein
MSSIHDEDILKLKEIIDMQAARILDQNLLYKIFGELQACRTSPEANKILSHFGPSLFPGIRSALYLRSDAQKLTFERVITWGGFKKGKRIFTQDQCQALHRMQPHFVENPHCNGLACKHAGQPHNGCCFCIPLMVDSSALGVLQLQSDQEELTPWETGNGGRAGQVLRLGAGQPAFAENASRTGGP